MMMMMMLSPSDGGEGQLKELCSVLCVFLRALRRFLSNTPEQRGHIPSDKTRLMMMVVMISVIIAQCCENVHCEGYKQHRSDTARQTFTVPFCTVP